MRRISLAASTACAASAFCRVELIRTVGAWTAMAATARPSEFTIGAPTQLTPAMLSSSSVE